MEILFTDTLLPGQEEDIRRMTAACSGSLPEECDGWWLAVDNNGSVLSFLSLCQVGEERWEGTAFTRVQLRRRGYFSLILREACRNGRIPGNGELVFPVQKADRETCAVMNAIGAGLLCEERLMERKLCREMPQDDMCASFTYSVTGQQSGTYQVFMDTSDKKAAAAFSLELYETSACLYDFSVRSDLRNRGIGRAVLEQLFIRLANDGVTRLILQVSGDNTAAISLYEKTGFCTTEALLYFLY